MDLNDIQRKVEEFAKNLINNAKDDKEVENENVDKRKLIDEVAGIMKDAGCDDEDIRTAIGKMEKIGYDKSEAGKTDNKKAENEDGAEVAQDDKKVEELKKDIQKDVENKCGKGVKNSVDYFEKMNEVYNAAKEYKEEAVYVTRSEKLKAAEDYFSVKEN